MLIEQAKGVLAERGHVSVDAAFAHLRGYARHRNRRLGDVARDVIEGRLTAIELAELVSPGPAEKP